MPWRLLRLMAVVLAGIAAYFAALAVLGFRKLKNLPAGRCNNAFRPAVQAGDNIQIEIFLPPRWVVEV